MAGVCGLEHNEGRPHEASGRHMPLAFLEGRGFTQAPGCVLPVQSGSEGGSDSPASGEGPYCEGGSVVIPVATSTGYPRNP